MLLNHSTKNQHAPTLLICSAPTFTNVRFKNLPILVNSGYLSSSGKWFKWLYDGTYPLVWYYNYKNKNNALLCNFCDCQLDSIVGYYLCEVEYNLYGRRRIYNYQSLKEKQTFVFHKECIEPIANNYHPKHSLQVLIFNGEPSNKTCHCCWRRNVQKFHYCSICNFAICRDCAKSPVLLTIDHKRRHEHSLYYIPREASMICDVCALDTRTYFIYVCQQCDFVVHKRCIYSPRIIKISLHEHRLSFTSLFLSGQGERFCGVCRKHIDRNYGGYSCVKSCFYNAHSQCALDRIIWDGNELEGKPEESYEDITPFKEIGDGIIQHFSHKHHMRLYEDIGKTIEDNKRCQACALDVYEGDIFNCMECDFVLHKVCAYLPLKKQHMMHVHTLVLHFNLQKVVLCSACERDCNSFTYTCEMQNCRFTLDVNCAAVSEPYINHQFHPHFLFLSFKPLSYIICSFCGKQGFHLPSKICGQLAGECKFALCFRCATLPMKFRYKHDEHPLIFSYEKDANGQYWCDVCEQEISLKNGIYMCNDCNITLHKECLLGKDNYILSGKTFTWKFRKDSWDIIPNGHLTRYICEGCHKRCPDKIVYKIYDDKIFCSMRCIIERKT